MCSLRLLLVAALVAAAIASTHHCTGDCRTADQNARMNKVMLMKEKQHLVCVEAGLCPTVVPSIASGRVVCKDGEAAGYECKGMDLMSFTSLAAMGTSRDASDIWGWTDPLTRKEIAIVGVEDGTSFVDVTDAENPVVLGFMKATKNRRIIWHDIKVYKNHAFVVSEIMDHGMQVFDLTRLRSVRGVAVREVDTSEGVAAVPQFEPDTVYTEFGSSHNIVINEETGFAYSVGTRTCNSGLHMVDISDPKNPEFAGCFADDGYVHDAQCVVYRGPDERFAGQELCFCYNEDTLTIVNVNDKLNPTYVARKGYAGSQYTHQGWLNEDQSFLLLNDELDEVENANHHTRSMVWNVTDLTRPELTQSFYSEETVIDHNLYIHNNIAYESNYCGGLRMLDVHDMTQPLTEIAYFDVAPDCSTPLFQGSWSVYPYFESGNIIVSSIERGLFVVRPTGQ
eukprot:TRINITY_DN30_c0_g1_i1.p1 TRINITY_DN30_c0_g1~~TRINITY_DN30_c0_g1_i1.p1  ORF type:complete len:452 (+),score=161.34 TRINITY_DN30_c0_g1_i1:59-1414(+)